MKKYHFFMTFSAEVVGVIVCAYFLHELDVISELWILLGTAGLFMVILIQAIIKVFKA